MPIKTNALLTNRGAGLPSVKAGNSGLKGIRADKLKATAVAMFDGNDSRRDITPRGGST